MDIGRQRLPHNCPLFVDPSTSVWFVTISCAERGTSQLTAPEASKALLDSVRFRHEQSHWFTHLFLLMPDHCHVLLTFSPERKIAETIQHWKRWTSSHIGIRWQTDFFDHRLRNQESFSAKYRYILQNPIRANLIPEDSDWPHMWIP